MASAFRPLICGFRLQAEDLPAEAGGHKYLKPLKPDATSCPDFRLRACYEDHPNHVSRRRFLTRSATVGALAPERALGRNQPGVQADDALVAPHYRGFLKKSVTELPTPALLIDLDIFERNLQALASYMKGRPVTFRPHGKAHKSPAIGKLQLASGARGLCAAKLGEADVLIRGGITDVLITAEVVGRLKIERLMALLALTPDVKAVVDNEQNVIDLSTAVLASKGKGES